MMPKPEWKVGTCLICRAEIAHFATFCREHYLQKEARYALGDLDPDKKWDNPEDAQSFKDWGLQRLKALAEFYIDRDWSSGYRGE